MMRSIALMLLIGGCALPPPPQLPASNDDGPPATPNALVVTPTQCDFGAIALGSVGACGLTLENTGETDVVLENVRFSDDTPSALALQGNPPPVIPAGESSTIRVVAAPSELGVITGELFIDELASIPLRVEGVVDGCIAVASIKSINGAPAVSGAQPSIEPLDNVVVTAELSAPSASSASIVAYTWQVVERPAGSTVLLASPTSIDSGFVFNGTNALDVAGSYVVRVSVTDSLGAVCVDDLTFVAEPTDGVFVQLMWSSSAGDLDLHIARGDPPAWCVDELPISQEDSQGYGPESFNGELAPGVYGVGVRNVDGSFTGDATIKVFVGGSLRSDMSVDVTDFSDAVRIVAGGNGTIDVTIIDTQVADPC